jgi:acetamidase/formamidase
MAHEPSVSNPSGELSSGGGFVERRVRCVGIDKDLLEASRKACKHMLAWLIHTKDPTKEEACVLMSVAGDLKIVEAVDMPNYAVSMSIPLSIFVGERYNN